MLGGSLYLCMACVYLFMCLHHSLCFSKKGSQEIGLTVAVMAVACTITLEQCKACLKPYASMVADLAWKTADSETFIKQYQQLLKAIARHTRRLTQRVDRQGLDAISVEASSEDADLFATRLKNAMAYVLQKNRDASTGAKMSTLVRVVVASMLRHQHVKKKKHLTQSAGEAAADSPAAAAADSPAAAAAADSPAAASGSKAAAASDSPAAAASGSKSAASSSGPSV